MAIPEWLKVTPATGIGNRVLTLSPDENTGTGQREYVLTAETGYGVQATCRVIQEGAEEFIEITSSPENLDPESVLFQVQCRTNAETLLFTLPDEISVEAIFTPDGRQHISPGIEFDVPENPGEAGSFNFRVVFRLPEVNNTVADEEYTVIIRTGAGAAAECKVTRQGRAVIAEDFTESISIPATGGSVETEEMSLEVHPGVASLGVSVFMPEFGSFGSLLTAEISLKVSSTISVKPGGDISTMADIGEIVPPFIWTEWKDLSGLTDINIAGRKVYGYKLRITAPENDSTTDIREATVTMIFSDASGQIPGTSTVSLGVTQDRAEKKISGSTTVTVKNSTSASKEGRCYLTLKSASGETLMICGYLGNSVSPRGAYMATYSYTRTGEGTFRATALTLNMGSHSSNLTVSLKVGGNSISGTVKNMSELAIGTPFTMTPGNTYNVSGTITLTD